MNSERRKFLRCPLIIAVVFSATTAGYAQDAPFGFSWGPVERIPKPWTASREANITTLFYDSTSPVAGVDTDQVIVEICQSEGLQQVIWVSRDLAQDELRRKFELVHQQASARFGEPTSSSGPMTESWRHGRVSVAVSPPSDGHHRLVMAMRGELFDKCSSEHQAQVGHPAWLHFDNLVKRTY